MATAYNGAYLASVLRTFAQISLRETSDTLVTSGCVKTHVCMKNKPYTSFKSENKVNFSRNFGFSHSLTLGDILLSTQKK